MTYEQQAALMQELYERFLDCEYTPKLFYSVSVNEAIDLIESYARRKQQREKESLQQWISILDVFGSNLIKKMAMSVNGEDISEASMVRLLPELFSANAQDNRIDKKQKTGLSAEMQLYKAQRIHHAYHVNRQRGGAANGK